MESKPIFDAIEEAQDRRDHFDNVVEVLNNILDKVNSIGRKRYFKKATATYVAKDEYVKVQMESFYTPKEYMDFLNEYDASIQYREDARLFISTIRVQL